MKNRRNVVIALLLIAVLCVGIGYAALNDTIDFTGKISYTPDFQIVWGEATYTDGLLTDVSGTDTDKFTVSMNTSEWVVDETKTFTVTVKNASRYDAENVAVQALTTTAVEDNYTVTAQVTGADTIAVGGTTTVTVTVTMDSYPADTVTNAEFTFQVYADQVA